MLIAAVEYEAPSWLHRPNDSPSANPELTFRPFVRTSIKPVMKIFKALNTFPLSLSKGE